MADQVAFESPAGHTYGMYEDFPLRGGPIVKCLVLQPEDGGVPTRVAADGAEADRLRERFPALKELGAAKPDEAA